MFSLFSKKNTDVPSVTAPKVTGSTQITKYIGLLCFAALVFVLIHSLFQSDSPSKKLATPSQVEIADNADTVINLGDASTAKKIVLKSDLPAKPAVTPPPSRQNTAAAMEEQARLKSPSSVYSANTEDTSARDPETSHVGSDSNLSFAERAARSPVVSIKAKRQTDTRYKIFQGKLIPAILETALNSDLPGFVRAVISDDVFSESGDHVLLAKGTRLIGSYNSAIAVGQTRVYIMWTRAITPNNIDIALGSPGADELGAAGMTGFVDSHFFKIFGNSMLLSILGAGASGLSANSSNIGAYGNPYQLAVTQGLMNSSTQLLQNNMNIHPTIHMAQGTKIFVFVARDLDFSPVFQSVP